MTKRDQVLTLDSERSEPDIDIDDTDDVDDTVEAGSPEGESDSDTPATGRRLRRPSLRGLALGAGAVLLVASMVTAAVLAWDLRNQRVIDDAGQQALAAAQQYAVVLTSVDAAKLDSNFATVLDGATGEFKDMYSQSSAGLKQVLIDNKAQATGTVLAAGIKSATPERVEVMLFVDQAVTNALNPEPRLDRNRIIMTMEKINGRWLASNVELP